MILINNKPKTYFWSDLHLSHRKMYDLPFPSTGDPNKPMRDFDSMEECEEYMIDQYNQVIKDNDKVYFIGDVVMDKKSLPMLKRMKKGHKYLVMGNHDDRTCITNYKQYFNKIYGCLYMNKFKIVISHFPCHMRMLRRSEWGPPRFLWNLHGHTHDSYVMQDGSNLFDDRYINVSVEATNYRPISAEELGITPIFHNDLIEEIMS